MKKIILVTIAFIVTLCDVSAQVLGDFYAAATAGAVNVNQFSSPEFGARVGFEGYHVLVEGEFSYLSMNTADYNQKQQLSTFAFGVNVGWKIVSSYYGHLALTAHTGESFQKDIRHDFAYPTYPCTNDGMYHAKYYVGIGANGGINVSHNLQIFAEARYQLIPTDGRGGTQWGLKILGGVKYYF